MRAAELAIDLTELEVHAESESDGRGLLGIGEVSPGPLTVTLRIRVASSNASRRQLHELVAYADAHAPVGDAIRRAVPVKSIVEIVS